LKSIEFLEDNLSGYAEVNFFGRDPIMAQTS
jgi:hypothetical protein